MIPNVLSDKREPCRQIFQVMETEYGKSMQGIQLQRESLTFLR